MVFNKKLTKRVAVELHIQMNLVHSKIAVVKLDLIEFCIRIVVGCKETLSKVVQRRRNAVKCFADIHYIQVHSIQEEPETCATYGYTQVSPLKNTHTKY